MSQVIVFAAPHRAEPICERNRVSLWQLQVRGADSLRKSIYKSIKWACDLPVGNAWLKIGSDGVRERILLPVMSDSLPYRGESVAEANR